MRHLTLAITIICLLVSCNEKNSVSSGFLIEGEFIEIDSGYIELTAWFEGKEVTIDSCKIIKGKFKLEGNVDAPYVGYLNYSDSTDYIKVFLENTNYTIAIPSNDITEVKIIGSNLNDLLYDYLKQSKLFTDKMDSLHILRMKANENPNKKLYDSINSIFRDTNSKRALAAMHFALAHKTSPIAPYVLNHVVRYLSVEELDRAFVELDTSLKSMSDYKYLENLIRCRRITGVGQKFIDIQEQDTSGSVIALSEILGKVTLLDFWNSGCMPCRMEFPFIKEVYKKYHNKGFEVFGVSFDESRKAWARAIRKDDLPWYNVSELDGFDSEIYNAYCIISIPDNILIDKNGIVVARDIHYEELEEKVKSLIEI